MSGGTNFFWRGLSLRVPMNSLLISFGIQGSYIVTENIVVTPDMKVSLREITQVPQQSTIKTTIYNKNSKYIRFLVVDGGNR